MRLKQGMTQTASCAAWWRKQRRQLPASPWMPWTQMMNRAQPRQRQHPQMTLMWNSGALGVCFAQGMRACITKEVTTGVLLML